LEDLGIDMIVKLKWISKKLEGADAYTGTQGHDFNTSHALVM
jgi:hypothetical protein